MNSFLVSISTFGMCFDYENNTQELKCSLLSKKNPVNLSFVKQNFNSLVNVETLCSSKFWPARQKLLLVQIYTKEVSPID